MKIDRKVAIFGTARAGKTVFLTSLINHLIEHNRSEFIVGDGRGVQITDFKINKVPPKKGAKFNYGACRDALVNNGQWPEKTRDTSHFICDFKRSDWRFNRNELHFFDLPGERFADVAIAKYSDYQEWSDHVMEYFESDTIYRQLAKDFMDLQQKGANGYIAASDVLNSYRKTLAQFVINFKPMVSPSTFLLDLDGKLPKAKTSEEFLVEAMSRHLGLPPERGKIREFAPLSEQARKNNVGLTKTFSKSYKEYRKTVVMPLFDNLKSSKRLIILIDIPSLLNGGVAMYNDNREIIENLFKVLEPESWFWRLFSSAVKIDRVAFVATKCDSVHPLDLENAQLRKLLRQMTEKFAFSLVDVEYEWFTCSAVVSAKLADGDYCMRGKLVKKPTDGEVVFKVSKLPDSWPKDWKPGDYNFPSVLPRVPANRGIAPKHHDLDKIFTFITKD